VKEGLHQKMKYQCSVSLSSVDGEISPKTFKATSTRRRKDVMICRLFVIRHAETYDNARGIFSGWRDSVLTPRGFHQSEKIAHQLRQEQIDYAFTSHLKRAVQTLEVVLRERPVTPVFTDDRIIERCYGLLQGKSKRKVSDESPEWYAKVHRAYEFPPPQGESLKMVEKRTLHFLAQLEEWLQKNPGNVAISCHGNSMRPIRRVYEHLSLRQMLQLENPQDRAMIYTLNLPSTGPEAHPKKPVKADWRGVILPRRVFLASDTRNTLKRYY
jgi:2,3-bisphosphoglycerate-dependent phosphoglycerate mutase